MTEGLETSSCCGEVVKTRTGSLRGAEPLFIKTLPFPFLRGRGLRDGVI